MKERKPPRSVCQIFPSRILSIRFFVPGVRGPERQFGESFCCLVGEPKYVNQEEPVEEVWERKEMGGSQKSALN